MINIKEKICNSACLMGRAGSIYRHTYGDDYDSLVRLEERPGDMRNTLSAVMYRNDIASAKIDLFTGAEAAHGVSVVSGDFIADDGTVLDAEIEISFIRNVIAYDIKKPVPDVLFSGAPIDMEPRSVCSVWIKIKTSENAKPGIYNGSIAAGCKDSSEKIVFPFELEVQPLTLSNGIVSPELWQYPYSSNRYYSGKSSSEYFSAHEKDMCSVYLNDDFENGLISQIKLYAEAGGRAVTVTIVEDPWNSQTPDPYPSMIKWKRKRDGRFEFDYTDFDKWIRLNEKYGVDGPILSFSIASWGNNVEYFDEKECAAVKKTLEPGDSEWQDTWRQFLVSYAFHTTENGWFDRVYIAMDERPADVAEKVLDLVESVKNAEGKAFKTSIAVYSFDCEYLFDRIDSLSFAYQLECERVKLTAEHRRALGLTTTVYTCGAQCSALANEPYEGLYSLLYIAKCRADGFLRWALDAFNDFPLEDSYHLPFAAGDIYLIYPDLKTSERREAKSSARYEVIAEGCRLLAKINYLRNFSDDLRKKTDLLVDSLGSLNEGDAELEALRVKAGIEELSRLAASNACR